MKRVIPHKPAGFYQREDYIWPLDTTDRRYKIDLDRKIVIYKAIATVYYNEQYETFYFDSDAEALAFAEEVKGKIEFIEIKSS